MKIIPYSAYLILGYTAASFGGDVFLLVVATAVACHIHRAMINGQ